MNEEENILKDEKLNTIIHKDSALKRLDSSFLKHIDKNEFKKRNILAYWIEDFSNYHDDEETFDVTKLKVFKRGDIIKVNLGFNIGNELGGLHYCVVINKKDSKKSGTLNVIPLSSFKEGKKYNSNTCIDLGDELYLSIIKKHTELVEKIHEEFFQILNIKKDSITEEDNIKFKELLSQLQYLSKIKAEIDKMKHGSIALVHQITTISKQRIYKTDMLKNIKLSNESLDKLDKKIKELFTK